MTHRVTELHGYKIKTNLSSSTIAYFLPRHEQILLLKPVCPRPHGSSHRFHCYVPIMSFVIPAHNFSMLTLFCQSLTFFKTSTENKPFLEYVPWANGDEDNPKLWTGCIYWLHKERMRWRQRERHTEGDTENIEENKNRGGGVEIDLPRKGK